MGKLIVLSLVFVSALASTAGFFYLNAMIHAGDMRMAAGHEQIASGQAALSAGEARLEAGKSKLAKGKKAYSKAHDNPLLVAADAVLHGGSGFSKARDQIAEGDKKVRAGQTRLDSKTILLEEGKLRLEEGKRQLRWARTARIASGAGAIVLFAASMVLGFFWRRSLIRTFTGKDERARGRAGAHP